MAKVIGLGGLFFLCKDVDATRAWYTRVLSVQIDDYGVRVSPKRTLLQNSRKGHVRSGRHSRRKATISNLQTATS